MSAAGPSPPRDHQAPRQTRGHHVSPAPGLTLPVPPPAVPDTPAQGLRVFALGQRLRHSADHVAHRAGTANGARLRRWFQEKKAGWSAVLADPQIPVTSTLLDQTHNAIERQLVAMKGFHHPGGSQQAFLRWLAHLYNLIP